ncbi:GntR family transcriptional regulator [Celeribacter sp.]|uniref:GntR family transcriptional regulator n=1 Tax=Celeribacter sp. TaxID=1890673 RepID=UPI003A905613
MELMLKTRKETGKVMDATILALPEEAKSKATTAYRLLRQDILYGRLAPGEKLAFSKLRENYPVGTAPLREALVKLANTGLVEGAEQRGFRVAPVSVEDLWDLTENSIYLEKKAVREAILRASKTDDRGLLAAFHRLEDLLLASDHEGIAFFETWNVAHAQFHEQVVQACGSPVLLGLRAQLYERCERYRCLSIALSGEARDLNREHREMMMAVLERDATRAEELVTLHWTKTAEIIIESLPILRKH